MLQFIIFKLIWIEAENNGCSFIENIDARAHRYSIPKSFDERNARFL